MIVLTEPAAQEVKAMIDRRNEEVVKEGRDPQQLYLRVGVKGGGCSGFSYSLDVTETKADDDELTPQHGIDVICDPKSHLYLNGTTVAFKSDLMWRGFVFENPNASGSCGCGTSFSVGGS
jgi:iron-sulfur cluster assembly protein